MEETKKDISNGHKKREEKLRKRDYKSLENVLKEVNLQPENLRFDLLTTKYGELYDEYRTAITALSIAERNIVSLQRAKDQLQNDQSKLILARSRMESLCRELQHQNKAIKEDNLTKIREEEEKRKEVATKFQATLNEVTTMMQENTEKNIKLRDDNLEMANKIASLYDQFEKRKEHQSKMEHQLELERQLSQAQIEKAQLELKAEQELWNRERKLLEDKSKNSEENCAQLQYTVKELHENLELYSDKYDEFKSSLSKNNQVFDNCKIEMDRMTKQILSLEKEVKIWKQRSERNAHVVLELTTTKQTQDLKLESYDKKLQLLQKLCRQLQVDRSSYIKLLKSNGIEPISQTCIEEKVNVNSTKKVQKEMTKKQKQLEELKLNLRVLQDQLTIAQGDHASQVQAQVDQLLTESNLMPSDSSLVSSEVPIEVPLIPSDVIPLDPTLVSLNLPLVSTESTLVTSDSTLVSPDSTVVLPDLTAVLPDLTMVSPDLTLPVTDLTFPVADSTVPVADSTLPVADSTLPVTDSTLPVADSTLPVTDSTLPVVDSALVSPDLPVVQSITSVNDTGITNVSSVPETDCKKE